MDKAVQDSRPKVKFKDVKERTTRNSTKASGKRRSNRKFKQPKVFAGMTTQWKPSKNWASILVGLAAGITTLPTHIIAEPA